MTGKELREIILDKWSCSYDVQLRSTKGRVFFQVMWKYLEQTSFPLTEEEYLERLNTVANYLNAWGSVDQVREHIQKTKDRPRLGKVISIALDLGERASEWILD